MTKVIRVEVMVLDFDDLGIDGVRETIENTKYPNHFTASNGDRRTRYWRMGR